MNRVDLTTTDLFVMCSLPNSTDVSLYLHHESGQERFVIHPFIRHQVATTHITATEIIHNPSVSFKTDSSCRLHHTPKADYLQQADALLSTIQRGDFSKAILSRIRIEKMTNPDYSQLFHQMVKRYPKAFTYLFNIPGQGTWMGASPEILLESNQDGFQTVALAGTLPVVEDKKPNWSNKEIQEQQIIVDYVSSKLNSKQIPFDLSPQRSSRAGNVYHLKSVFRSKAAIDPVDVALMLHPGPAISGYPIAEALHFIKEHELHKREHYCGFLGPVSDSSTSLFINLRCMQVFSDAVALYVGGGYTQDSNPEAEWQETELKSQTLLSVLKDSYIDEVITADGI